MHEPDGYPPANDMVIARGARRPSGRLVPFCRLDPHADAAGRGRARARRRRLRDQAAPARRAVRARPPRPAPVFALADERHLPVLCHAGRGIPALGRHAVEACSRYPGHAADPRPRRHLRPRLDLARAAEHPNLFFDTAWWSPSDLQALFALVPPGQILMASDAPYGTPAWGAMATLRHALQVGLDQDQLRGVLGGQATPPRWRARSRSTSAPRRGRTRLTRDPLLDRVYAFLRARSARCSPASSRRDARARGARLRGGRRRPAGSDLPSRILPCSTRARSTTADDDGRPPRFAQGLQFVVAAAVLARTPDVPVPAATQSGASRAQHEHLERRPPDETSPGSCRPPPGGLTRRSTAALNCPRPARGRCSRTEPHEMPPRPCPPAFCSTVVSEALQHAERRSRRTGRSWPWSARARSSRCSMPDDRVRRWRPGSPASRRRSCSEGLTRRAAQRVELAPHGQPLERP